MERAIYCITRSSLYKIKAPIISRSTISYFYFRYLHLYITNYTGAVFITETYTNKIFLHRRNNVDVSSNLHHR